MGLAVRDWVPIDRQMLALCRLVTYSMLYDRFRMPDSLSCGGKPLPMLRPARGSEIYAIGEAIGPCCLNSTTRNLEVPNARPLRNASLGALTLRAVQLVQLTEVNMFALDDAT